MLSEIRNKAEIDEALQSAEGKLVVVDFSAIWCGPCRMIAPLFEELSNKYPDVVFLKVDVDDAADVTKSFGIVSLPTFQFYLNGKKVDEFSGARKDLLEEKVKSNMP